MSERGRVTLAKAIQWIRMNCWVNTGSGIYGEASCYTAKQIEQAISRLPAKRRSERKKESK